MESVRWGWPASYNPYSEIDMASIGRNDPCPCGSGKKYKRCCLLKERERQRRDHLESQAAGVALKWLTQHHGDELEAAFRKEFLGVLTEDERKRLASLPESLLEMAHINGHELVLAEGELELVNGKVSCADLVFGVGGPLMDAVERSFLEKLCSRSLSLYEVVESSPGKGFHLRDLLAPDEPARWISERAGSQGPGGSEGSILAARLIPGSPWKLSGAVYPLPETQVLPLLNELRGALGGASDPSRERRIRSTTIVRAWLKFLIMPAPTMVDAATGEDALLVTDHYRVADWGRLEAALAAAPDVSGNRQRGWVRLDDPEADYGRTLLAINPGKGDRLEVFGRSLALADNGKDWLRQVAGDAIESITREITDPASFWDERHDEAPTAPALAPEPPALPPDFHRQLYEQMYRNWADDPIPALGDLTPRQAVRTPEGRRQVTDLLESYERGEKRQARKQGRPEESFDFL